MWIRTDGVRADAIRTQGRAISGVQRCGEGALGEMIVECSTSSQVKSDSEIGGRKRSLV